ncbi:MAG: secondary thiamine-phosphate synthase enzyme YjbQ [Thermoleophilia bacterium]|jgi:secondary thiamine-phosphate synthase enzyme
MQLVELRIPTDTREVFVDITARVQAAITDEAPSLDGIVHIFIPHTTAGITINEGADPSVCRDMIEGLRRLVPRVADYDHVEGNSDAHIKAGLMGAELAVPVKAGRLHLGTWQSIYLAEFDGPRRRTVWVILPNSSRS